MQIDGASAARLLQNNDKQVRDLLAKSNQGKGTTPNDSVELSQVAAKPGAPALSSNFKSILGDMNQQLAPLLQSIQDGVKEQSSLGNLFQDPNNTEEVRARAQELLDGYFNAENTADRIFGFAFAFFDGSKDRAEFAEEMRGYIDQGFEEARKIVGELPDISNETYDLIQEKIDAFIDGDEEKEGAEAGAGTTVEVSATAFSYSSTRTSYTSESVVSRVDVSE
jgi:hypothetical protein